jgi:hypothetical protein
VLRSCRNGNGCDDTADCACLNAGKGRFSSKMVGSRLQGISFSGILEGLHHMIKPIGEPNNEAYYWCSSKNAYV